MNGKILTVSTVLAVMLFTGCGSSDKSTRSASTNLGENIGLSTKSVATQQTPIVSTKSTLQTGTEFTISKDIKKDTVIGKVESDKLDGEILSLSLCGDCANYFSIDENGTLKLECDLPEDFEEATLTVEATVKKDGQCSKFKDKINIKISNGEIFVKNLLPHYIFDSSSYSKLDSPIESNTITISQFISFADFSATKDGSLGIHTMMLGGDDYTNNKSFIWYLPDTQSLRFASKTIEPINNSVKLENPLELNKIYHIVTILDNGNVTFYVDGKNVGSIIGENFDSFEVETIGHGYSKYNFKGSIDSLKFFDKVLTEEEITKIYKEQSK